MNKYKKVFAVAGVLVILGAAYYLSVIKPNIVQQKRYKECIQDSITQEQARHLNYAGSIRDDNANPKTCSYGRETFTEFTGNKFLP